MHVGVEIPYDVPMNDGKATQSPEATAPDTGLTIRQYYVMVGIGAFVTTLAQPAVIGRLPFSLLLKTQLHFTAETLALFMFIATFAWNVKPIAGILSDSFPLLGTRRRHYMLFGAGLAALCWFLMGVVPKAYWPLLLAAFGADHVDPSDAPERGVCQQRSARRVSRDDGVRLDRRHRHRIADRAHDRDVFRADRATGRHTRPRSITECRPAAPDVHQVEVAVGRRRVSRARLHLARLHDATALPADRQARLHPAVHRVDGNDRRRGRPRRRRALWRRLPAVQPATAPYRLDCGQRPRHAALPHLRARRRPIHSRAQRLRSRMLRAVADGPRGAGHAAGMREPRLLVDDERTESRARRLRRHRLQAGRQLRLGLSPARVAQRGDDNARPRLHSVPAAIDHESQGWRGSAGVDDDHIAVGPRCRAGPLALLVRRRALSR